MGNTENKIRINTFTVNNNEAVSTTYILTDNDAYVKYVRIHEQIISTLIYDFISMTVAMHDFVDAANEGKLDMKSIVVVRGDSDICTKELILDVLDTFAQGQFEDNIGGVANCNQNTGKMIVA